MSNSSREQVAARETEISARHIAGESLAEVASALGMSYSGAAHALQRAQLRKMRDADAAVSEIVEEKLRSCALILEEMSQDGFWQYTSPKQAKAMMRIFDATLLRVLEFMM